MQAIAIADQAAMLAHDTFYAVSLLAWEFKAFMTLPGTETASRSGREARSSQQHDHTMDHGKTVDTLTLQELAGLCVCDAEPAPPPDALRLVFARLEHK